MFKDRRARKHGLPAEATVLAVRKRSQLTTNELRDFEHELFARPSDFHLTLGSPVLDAGDPLAAAGLDLDGMPLLVATDAAGNASKPRPLEIRIVRS
jgi:hypothetical protein